MFEQLLWCCTGRAILHGSSSFSARGVRFPSSEVGNPNFSQYSELVMIWNLFDFDGEAMRILIGLN